MPFVSGPDLRYVGDGIFELTAPAIYQGATDGFTVPAGFRTDLASVPRPVQWLVPKDGTYEQAAVLHDWLCTCLESAWRADLGPDMRFVRAPADAVATDGIFRRVMREAGVPVLIRWLMWTGVRLGALGTPARRPGWWSTAPLVVLLSLLMAPFVLPTSLIVGLGLIVVGLLEVGIQLPGWLARRMRRG